jgi:hypothetical protein
MSSGRGHDRAKRDIPGAVRDRASSAHGRRSTLQQAAGNQAVASLAGGSTPLAGGPRAALESEYDVELGQVRLHSGAEAQREASSEGAPALTRGGDVYLSDAAARDPVVIGHELVHVIQQLRPGTASADGDLEAEASAVSEGTSEAISGGAAFGAVQTFWPFDDDKEKQAREVQRRDEQAEMAVKKLGVLESTEEWKKYIDDPLVGGWLRDHPGRFDPRGENPEFQRWVADPKERPSGATATARPPKPVELREAKPVPWIERAGETKEQRQLEKAVWQSWSPRDKAMWARSLIEAERRRHIESMIPEKGSVGEALWTIGEETGVHSIMRAYTGETEWAQPLTPGERFSEAVLGTAKGVQTGLLIASGLPELRAGEAGAVVPRYADELLSGAGRETLAMVPTEAQAVERATKAAGRGGQTVEELAKSAEGKFVKGQDVVLPQQPFGQLGPPEFPPQIAPPKPTTGGGVVVGAAPEVEAGAGLRLQPKAAPQVVPEPVATPKPTPEPQKLQLTPEMAGETGAAESGWAQAESQAARERFAPRKDVPMPVSPAPEVGTAKELAREAVQTAPLIEKQERRFPAPEERPPIAEKEQPPPMVIDPEKREKWEAPAPLSPEQGKKELPPAIQPKEGEEMIAAPQKGKKKSKLEEKVDKQVEEAFTEPKGKVDVRKTPPQAEEVDPRKRELALTKKQKGLVADYEQLGTEKLPDVLQDVLQEQEATPTRKRLAVLKDRWETFMHKVGDRPALTTAERKRAEELLKEARELSEKDFKNVQDAVWLRLRRDPDLLKIEKKLRKEGVVGPGKGALQVPVRRVDDPSGKPTWESLNLEHRVRRSDDPWMYNDPANLIVTDPAQNQEYLEAIRRGAVWPTYETEEFVTRHGLTSQPYDFAPGSRPIPQEKP